MPLINTLAISDTFRSWLARTNTIIDLLNSNTVVVGGAAIGAFTIGNSTHTGSSLIINGGKFTANMNGMFLTATSTFGANVTVNASALLFTVSSNVTLLQSPSGTFINASTLTVNAPGVFLGVTSVSNTFAVTKDVTLQANLTVGNNFTSTNTAYLRSIIFSQSGAVVSDTISSSQYNDYTVTGLTDAQVLHLNPNTQDVIFTGIAAPSNLSSGARLLYIQNLGTYKVTIKSENGSSVVTNRFKTPLDADLDIPAGGSLTLLYATSAGRWRPLGGASGSSSNGASYTTLTVSGNASFGANTSWGSTLFVDMVNGRVGVGTNTPTQPFHVVGGSILANTTFTGWANVIGGFTVSGNGVFNNSLTVGGAMGIGGTALIVGAASLSNTLAVTGAVSMANTLSVTGNAAFTGLTSIQEIVEQVNLTGGAGATFNFDVLSYGVLYGTANATSNWVMNVRGSSGVSLSSLLAVSKSITITLLATQGATAYYPTGLTIDGVAVTPRWQNGSAPIAGSINSVDAYTYTIIKLNSSPAYAVLASQVKYA